MFSTKTTTQYISILKIRYPQTIPLTNREMEILLLIAIGLSNQSIRKNLNIAKRIVERHVTNIIIKLLTDTDELNKRVCLSIIGNDLVQFSPKFIKTIDTIFDAKTPFPTQTSNTKSSKILHFR